MKQKGIIKFRGTYDDVTFYEKDGRYLARKKGNLDKERIMNDKQFARTRENMKEFGAAAHIGKQFRETLTALIDKLGGRLTSARLTGIFRRIASQGSGKRGQRPFNLFPNKQFLNGFEFNDKRAFSNVLGALLDDPVIDANRNEVVWNIPAFELGTELKFPESATHYQIVMATTTLSDFVYDGTKKVYEEVEPALSGKRSVAMTDYLSTDVVLSDAVTLTTDLGLTEALPETLISITVVGVLFFLEQDGDMVPVNGAKALKIGLVA
jgi:hypothetical protein